MKQYIHVDASYREHRKTKRLQRILGNDARWLPIYLWMYCVAEEKIRLSGDLSALDDQDLADALGYDGDGKKLREAFIASGFLTASGEVVGWRERYAEKFEFYQRRAAAGAAAMWKKRRENDPAPSTPPPSEEGLDRDKTRERLASIAKRASSELEASAAPARSRFPTLVEWTAEGKAKHSDWPEADIAGAWRHYQSLGWKKGQTPIVAWRQCVETCYRNHKDKTGKTLTPRWK